MNLNLRFFGIGFSLGLVVASLGIAAVRGAKHKEPPMGFVSSQDAVLRILDGETKKPKAEMRAWRFTESGLTCYVFLQKQTTDMWVPTASCVPSWMVW